MKTLKLMVVALAAVMVMSVAFAEEKAPADTKIVGKVAVTKDGDAVKAITVTVGEGEKAVAYDVVLDDNGKKLADLNGKVAEVTGVVAEKDKKMWITVKEAKEVKPAAK